MIPKISPLLSCFLSFFHASTKLKPRVNLCFVRTKIDDRDVHAEKNIVPSWKRRETRTIWTFKISFGWRNILHEGLWGKRKQQTRKNRMFSIAHCADSCFDAHNQHRLPTHQPVIDRLPPSRCHVSAKTPSIFSPTRLWSHFESKKLESRKVWVYVTSNGIEKKRKKKSTRNPFFHTIFRH